MTVLLAILALVAQPYGICAHITRSEYGRIDKTLMAMEMAGMKYVRSDVDYGNIFKADGSCDFSYYDGILAKVEAKGMSFLPILYGPENPPRDFNLYSNYVARFVAHYGMRIPVIEIWNEANIPFFKGSDPKLYAKTLQTAYAASKAACPDVRVTFTGTAGVPHDWIREVFDAGATNCFDVMNVHPYTHPAAPEPMIGRTDQLKALMAEYGIGDKPIWFTEIGWPTHKVTIPFTHILLAGLKVARPEQKTWNVIVANNALDGNIDDDIAKQLIGILPAGSTARVCNQSETCAALAAGGVDAVVYPADESYPADTTKAVLDFMRDGGVLVDFGGIPCYYGARGGERPPHLQNGGGLGQFPFGYRGWWSGDCKTYPREDYPVHATPAGLAAGVKQEPTGFPARRFLAPDRVGKEDEWIPLVESKMTNGVTLTAAVVIRYHGKMKGAAVLCSLYAKGMSATNNEENQARFTARALGISFAEEIESYFAYHLRAFETDPYYSERHFGIMHANFQPKPAYSAYANFVTMRPAGSVQLRGEWYDAERKFFHPAWRRPDGVKGGMLWVTGNDETRTLHFSGKTAFYNQYGLPLPLLERSEGVYEVELSGAPVYFEGSELLPTL